MKKYSIIAVLAFLFSSCELEETPIVQPDKAAIFHSEKGLEAYSYSFYEMFPSASDQADAEQSLVDYGATTTLNAFININGYSENNASGWSWSNLRNINYFIVNCTDPAVSETVRNNYIGLARFFRAWFYYDKVRRFGDVPWIDHPLSTEDETLYAPRDSRELVMEKVYEDLIFAAEHITRTSDATSSLITKWAAYAFASRVALFEGTFRKYHKLNLATSADTWLQRAVTTAEEVMKNAGKSLNSNYRALFTSEVPPTNETMLAICSSAALGVKHNANWHWISPSTSASTNLIRDFLCTYLQKDGTPYTTRAGWETEDFYEEFQNRDSRLQATLRYPGYKREGKLSLPDFAGFARIGYHPMKLSVDATIGDSKTESTQALQLIRYAEVLLNFAEAKAELGTLTDSDWKNTIGALRKRAGITGGLDIKPATADPYLQSRYYPEITDPVLLEIRRERAVELVLEGFRFDDLRRWKRGDLIRNTWTGMYISDINIGLDVDHDGNEDVMYHTADKKSDAETWQKGKSGRIIVPVSTDVKATGIQVHAVAGHSGYYLAWFTHNDGNKVWGPKQYLYPLPVNTLTINPNLTQNPGWEDGATNDGN